MLFIRNALIKAAGVMSSFIRCAGNSSARLSFVKRLVCVLCLLAMLLPVFGTVIVAADDAPELSEQSVVLYPEDGDEERTVKLDGLMPVGSSVEAVDYTDAYAHLSDFPSNGDELLESEKNGVVIAAYDITIKDSDNEEYQPGEENPINVEINNPNITSGGMHTLWHIREDGTRERVSNYDVRNGKIIFQATSFSIYAVIDIEGPRTAESVTSMSALTSDRADAGFILYYGATSYFTSTLKSNGCLTESNDINEAAIWYFEHCVEEGEEGEEDEEYFKIFTYVGGVKKYIQTTSGNNITLGSTGDKIEVSPGRSASTFFLKKLEESRWLQHSNGGNGIRYYTDNLNNNNSQIKMYYADSFLVTDDVYHLSGKSLGIMHYLGGTIGDAFMADEDNTLDMVSTVVRTETGSKILYVAEDADITMWNFYPVAARDYLISTEVGGVTKYLQISSSGLDLVDYEDASVITITSNNDHDIILESDGYALTMANGEFTVAPVDFSSVYQWMDLVEVTGLTEEDYVTYAADRVGISDVPDGSSVIVYTRIWNSQTSSYDFYAIDHDGTLYPCYARGDQIMWVGDKINSLTWDFIEYHYDDGTPNYYYELFNPYSRKYLAPQVNGNQVLSDHTIGINLPGRREGEYYSDILAWDNTYYTYASVKNDIANGEIVPGFKNEADTYYFAIVETPTPNLTTIETLDNNQYGITMKMVDFPKQTNSGGGFHGVQSDFLDHYQNAAKGLLSTNLDSNGYPTVTANGNNLGTLYAGQAPGTPYSPAVDVNHLFISSVYNSSGYFEFDSCQNFATLLDPNGNVTNNFTVYKELGTNDSSSTKTTLKHGQFFPYDNIQAGVYSSYNPQNLYTVNASLNNPNVGMLPDSDPRKYERLHTTGKDSDYYYGMELGASFIQTPNGKDAWGHDIIFEFTGDDDFWLYVDGELIIDLGGIHSAQAGNVNFSTGLVTVEGVTKTLRQVFTENYMTRNPNATQAELDEYLADYFEPGETIFKDYSAHDMKLFYMERGAGAANLHMRFNLSHVTPGSVMLTKTVTGTDDIDFKMVEYPFQIWYKDEETGAEHLLTNDNQHINVTYQNSTQSVEYLPTYTPPQSNTSYNSVYMISPGMSAEINFPSDAIEYRIVEVGINHEVYDQVSVNGNAVTGTVIPGTNRASYDSGWHIVKEEPSMVYDNHVDEENLRTLTFTKKLWNEHGKAPGNELTEQDDPTTFSFRLYLSNGVSDTLTLANMADYRVKDGSGHYCKWNENTGRFASVGYSDWDDLTDSQKTQCTFQTSMNGAISQIPADYSVEVPNLPVGVKFRVDERDYEVPYGYRLVEFERDSGSYIAEQDQALNTGWIRENESPHMYIHNKRGFELEVNKVWSDADYIETYDPIYIAVYLNDQTLLPDTVRQLAYPDTSYRYFFEDHLAAGATMDDYVVREVNVINPVVDSEGKVTSYDSIMKILDGGINLIGAVPNGETTPTFHVYDVTYEEGEATATSGITGEENVKTETITNTRRGGLVITLYDMDTGEPLAGGVFRLTHGNDVIGTFTSDANGRITVMYDFERNSDYTLTQISPPDTYVGLPNPVVFSVGNQGSGEVNASGNESQWQDGYPATDPHDYIEAYIDVFNKQYTLQAIKVDEDTGAPLSGAHFALYRGVNGVGGITMDTHPMPGYEDLVSGSDGVVPGIDNSLPPGRYYLVETAAPMSYDGFDDAFVFTISPDGEITVNSTAYSSFMNLSGTTVDEYVISVPNSLSNANLTVTKSIRGNFSNPSAEFMFTLTVAGAEAMDEFEWSKNGVAQANALHNGDNFSLSNGDSVTITLPKHVNITIRENRGNYTSSFKLGNATAEEVSSKTFTLTDDVTLAVTNTLEGDINVGIDTLAEPPVLFALISSIAFATAIIYYRRKRRSN